jgi:NAD(P)H-hydrate epimerase
MGIFTPPKPGLCSLVLLEPSERAEADRLTTAGGVSEQDLMEDAGRAVADAVRARWSVRPTTVLCGPGGNGGDGFVAARRLSAAGWPIRLALLGAVKHMPPAAAYHAGHWSGPVEPFSPEVLAGAELVIDGVFGVGLSRDLDGAAAAMIEAVKARRVPVCAIDIPSGVDGATGAVRGVAAPAQMTVTFFRKTPGHLLFPGRALCGEIITADIGIAAEVLDAIAPRAFENGPELWLARYPWPRADGQKYQRGEALVLGGETITGASRLTTRAAMRAGAGLVTLAAPAKAWPIYAAALPGAMVHGIDGPDDFKSLLADKRRNAVAIGPGAGVGPSTKACVLAALETRRPVVLDADALTAFAEAPTALFDAIQGCCILTPHEGEFARLFDVKGDKLARARQAAAQSGAIVLLKGADTVIAAPDGRAIINSNAPPQLATGGSGDVLTGFIVGLLAQGLDVFEAAAAGAWLHGEAGGRLGLGLVAEDLPEALPRVLQALRATLDAHPFT